MEPQGPFFEFNKTEGYPQLSPSQKWTSKGSLFSHINFEIKDRPNWFENPLQVEKIADSKNRWWKIPDFDSTAGDVKYFWDLSRFDWALSFAQQGTQNQDALVRLNDWISYWCAENKPYLGVNWKCGQEAGVRVIKVSLCALILKNLESQTDGLKSFILCHLKRIKPVVGYAISQSNNHAITEATALFIGGLVYGGKKGKKYSRSGSKLLENSVLNLILSDGTFSQYSTNYQRFVVDCLCFVELFRQIYNYPNFSSEFYLRVQSALHWLRQMTDPLTGEVPNMGHNDGTFLACFGEENFSDYRPSLQLGFALFSDMRAYDLCRLDQRLKWLGVPIPRKTLEPLQSETMLDGGFHILRNESARVYFYFPKYTFRPAHCDALHCDFWLGQENVLGDDGTFSYFNNGGLEKYFGSTKAHSTVEIDQRDQMEKFSRFLYKDWLQTLSSNKIEPGSNFASACYEDRYHALHRRQIRLEDRSFIVFDKIIGLKDSATLRWRLGGGCWEGNSKKYTNGKVSLVMRSSASLTGENIVKGYKSRFYGFYEDQSVLEITVSRPTVIMSKFSW